MGKKTVQNDTEEDLIMAFKVFDKVPIPLSPRPLRLTGRLQDGKGFVTSAELRFILGNLGDRLNDEARTPSTHALCVNRRSQETESLVNQADPSGGGQINYAQFVRSMYQAIQGR